MWPALENTGCGGSLKQTPVRSPEGGPSDLLDKPRPRPGQFQPALQSDRLLRGDRTVEVAPT